VCARPARLGNRADSGKSTRSWDDVLKQSARGGCDLRDVENLDHQWEIDVGAEHVGGMDLAAVTAASNPT
jgi:hypothetical protein